jgi:hypothetical protein
MKKTITVAALAIFAACNTNPTASTTDSAKSSADSSAMPKTIQSPYDIGYSSKFVMDDPKNAETLLALWKAYDNNNVASAKDMIADTIDMQMGGGQMIHASRDSATALVGKFRGALQSAVSRVSAIMAVKSTDRNQHWALIWGTETDTYKNGKIDSTDLQETWRFDSNGKANLMFQYARKAMPMRR